jgi:hypothetical protein
LCGHRDNGAFSVDETMDVSKIEQLTLSIGYVKGNTVREVFIGFVEVKETTDKRKIAIFAWI